MNDGLNLRIIDDPIAVGFTRDSYGLLIPDRERLQKEKVQKRFDAQLSADTGLARRLEEIYYSSDVKFTDRPYGTGPGIGPAYKLFGPPTATKSKLRGKLNEVKGGASKVEANVSRRVRRIESYLNEHVYDLASRIQPKDAREELILAVEKEQMLTGGPYDNTAIGDATKSMLNFIIHTSEDLDYDGTEISKLVVEGSLKLKEYFNDVVGIPDGSIKPVGAHVVRFLQENDGMIGFPVYEKSARKLNSEIAIRILVETGVDTRWMVNSTVKDPILGVSREANVIDAIAYALDNMVIRSGDTASVVTQLTRIQRHGYKVDGGSIIPKDGKTRSVYPNSAFAGVREAMTFTPLLQIWQEKRLPWMPSLQDKSTRFDMIWTWLKDVLEPKSYDALAVDWSKYDATVKGAYWATVIYYAIRPLYHADYQRWVDLSIYDDVYKYLIVSHPLAQLNNDLYSDALQKAPNFQIDKWTLFGSINGLISGLKFTHGGGSLYGELIIHYVVPRLLGYEPVFGPQAGDDTLMAIPKSMIHLDSVEKTYAPIVDAAKKCGLDINSGKQIWQQSQGEIAKIFLQELFHTSTDTRGVGTAFRYHAAAFFAEKDKGLSIAEQYMAIFSKYNNGYDNPFIKTVLREWLSVDDFIGALFKEKGVSAWDIIISGIGGSLKEISERIDLTYNWGLSENQIANGEVPIIPIIAEVASEMSFPRTAAEAIKRMSLQDVSSQNVNESDPDLDLITE